MSSPIPTPARSAALDQCRGYTVVGMCLANFLAPFAAIHAILKHNDTYFSYADTIMPGFLFVVGFAFRLTYLKRRRVQGRWPTARTYLRRSGKLLLLSLLIYFFVGDIPRWFNVREMPPEFMQTARRAGTTTATETTDDRKLPPVNGYPDLSSSAFALPPYAVTSAVERLRAWHALSWPEQLFVH